MSTSKLFGLASLIMIAPHINVWASIAWGVWFAFRAVCHYRKGD